MKWIGKWQNQYGSLLEITSEENNKITATFTTALPDSGFHGQTLELTGVHYGDCIAMAGGGLTAAGDSAVTYTGLLRNGKIETLWYVVSDAALSSKGEAQPAVIKKLEWWRSMMTGADTFEYISPM